MRPEARLLDYIDQIAPPVSAEEAIARRESSTRSWARLESATKVGEGVVMTKTDQSPKIKTPGPGRGLAWALAAFALVLTVGGLYLGFSGDDGEVLDQTTVHTPTTLRDPTPIPEGELNPGFYVVEGDGDPSNSVGMTFLIEGPGWSSLGEGPYRDSGVSLHLHPIELRFGPHSPGCAGTGGNPRVTGTTAASLADAFAANGFTVLEAPAAVSAFGYDGYHVIVEVPEGCDDAVGGRYDIFAYPGDVMEIWLFDIAGQTVMVEANWKTESTGVTASSEEDLAALRSLIDSVVLVP